MRGLGYFGQLPGGITGASGGSGLSRDPYSGMRRATSSASQPLLTIAPPPRQYVQNIPYWSMPGQPQATAPGYAASGGGGGYLPASQEGCLPPMIKTHGGSGCRMPEDIAEKPRELTFAEEAGKDTGFIQAGVVGPSWNVSAELQAQFQAAESEFSKQHAAAASIPGAGVPSGMPAVPGMEQVPVQAQSAVSAPGPVTASSLAPAPGPLGPGLFDNLIRNYNMLNTQEKVIVMGSAFFGAWLIRAAFKA